MGGGGVGVRRNSSLGGASVGGMEVGADGGSLSETEAGDVHGVARSPEAQRSKSWQGLGSGEGEIVQQPGALLTAASESQSGTRGVVQRRGGPPLGQLLERLEVSVPIGEEGTSVVVPRQRSPVRRNVARRSVGSFDTQSSSHSFSLSHSQSQSHSPSKLQAQAQSQLHPVRQSQTQSLPATLLSEQVEEARAQRLFSPQAVRNTSQDTATFRLTVQDSLASAGASSAQERALSGARAGAPGGEQQESEAEFALPGAIKLGLGDFIFYSIMVGRAAMYDMMTVYACYLAIIAGLGATLVLLAVTRRALPALPFSICLGVIFYLLTRILLEPFVVTMVTSLLYF